MATSGTHTFFKVIVTIPGLVSASRNVVEHGFPLIGGRNNFAATTSYETKIPFVMRFMIDGKIGGGGWVRLANLRRRGKSTSTTCQAEVDVHYESVQTVELMQVAPLRIFYFDIECYNQNGKGFSRWM